MIVFMTSSPTGSLDGKYQVEGLDSSNGFRDNLKKYWKDQARCLMITGFPEESEASEEMTAFFQGAVVQSGLSVSCFDLWDDRTQDTSREALQSYDAIFLGGGHVPTQNAFFHRLALKEKLQGFSGILVGISAGSMNCAGTVYAQPELPGEAVDPAYERFIPGLGLTDINILPHYQMVKDSVKDGLHLFRDITMKDSGGKLFVAIPDGSYVEIEGGHATVYGEAWKITPDQIQKICQGGECCSLS